MARRPSELIIFLAIAMCCGGAVAAEPNILLIISDDQGIDSSAQYALSSDLPVTPVLDGLADSGVVFDNVWATPTCATTRASILTGKHGFRTDFNQTPGVLSAEHTTIQQLLASHANAYASAVFGKWHVGRRDENHPATVGIDYFAGSIGNPGDYFDWDMTVNGATSPTFGYHTTVVTDIAIEWILEQSGPWFAWVAYAAPHPPFHLPPEKLHERDLRGSESDIKRNPRNYYLASIEAMDSEIGRLLGSLPDAERDNTIVIYVGDNGTPRRVLGESGIYRAGAKGTLNEGGIRVPMLVSGASVPRSAGREDALISVVDLYATIAEMAGAGTTAIHDSVSFVGAFGDEEFEGRATVFAGYDGPDVQGWAIRDAQYKLLVTEDEGEQLFDLYSDPGESQNLLPGNSTVMAIKDGLERAADEVRSGEGEENHDQGR